MKSPLFEGPLEVMMGGTDISWLLGFPVAALSYAILRRGFQSIPVEEQ